MGKEKRVKKPKHSVAVNGYTFRWDSDDDEELDAIFESWEEREWMAWLKKHLRFPFNVRRVEDGSNFHGEEEGRPFAVGSRMTVQGISEATEDGDLDFGGVLVEVECNGEKGIIPLQDLEVTPPDDPNYGHVKEWVVHYANR